MNARIAIEAGEVPGRAEQVATRIAFFVAGLGIAAWAPLVPYAKLRMALDDGALGLLLLCLGAGSILAMPLSGALASRFGCRRVLIGAVLLIAFMLPALATAAHLPLLALALFVFGAGIGSLDCVINIQAVIVERASGRSMMSGFHGLFSLGGIAGAAGASGLLMLGATPLLATLVVVAILLVAIAWAASGLLPYASKGEGPAFAIPHGIVLFIGVLCFVVFLAEGAMLDWSAVFLTDLRQVDAAYAGLGYAAFASTMTIGRLTGDRFVQRLGAQRIIISGGLCAAAGLALATLAPSWLAGLVGFALVGAGCSNIVPVLYTAIGRQNAMPEHIAVPAISTLGYAGILVGPAAIGAVAQFASLPIAFLVVAALLIGVAASAPRLRT
ncbi:MFS transporter [Bosea sp. BIWAKO-01]|uniref:MFS transporter n=1 Tax=Bosea sp. BIWAKO-01 TaxID=506668 RepID=UPI000853E01E|nr:MFS transporter [Bosea sp. BIWAKO-01]GAU81564.1 membrane protein mosC [Bosea sp. BIWAKO-01]